MTDSTRDAGPGEHLDAEALADLQEGLLEPGAARAAAEHLSACAACSADNRVLAGIPDRLAAAGDAGPVPDDVARRLDEALAAEPPVLTSGAATVTPLASRRKAPMGMRMVQAAAALVVVLAGVGIVLSAQLGGSDDATSTAGSAGDTGTKAVPEDGSFPVTASGRNWTQDSVVAAVPQLLTGALGAALSPSAATAEPAEPDDDAGAESSGGRNLARTEADRLAGGPALAECVGELNDNPVTPLAVDLATWQGDPAAVIVLPTPGDPTTVDVFVVKPSCPPGEFLFFGREARP